MSLISWWQCPWEKVASPPAGWQHTSDRICISLYLTKQFLALALINFPPTLNSSPEQSSFCLTLEAPALVTARTEALSDFMISFTHP